MRGFILLALVILISFQSCKEDKVETACLPPAGPEIREMRIAVVDNATGADMLASGAINFNDLDAVLLCNGQELEIDTMTMQKDGQPLKMLVFSENIPGQLDGQACNSIAMQWAYNDLDTLTFGSNGQKCGECCINYYPYIVFNAVSSQSTDSLHASDLCKTCFIIRK